MIYERHGIQAHGVNHHETNRQGPHNIHHRRRFGQENPVTVKVEEPCKQESSLASDGARDEYTTSNFRLAHVLNPPRRSLPREGLLRPSFERSGVSSV